MIKRRRFLFVVFLVLAVPLEAQYTDCNTNYAQKLNEGIALYHSGEYRAAARVFGAAHCPSLTANQHASLDDWALKCVTGINAQARTAAEAGAAQAAPRGKRPLQQKPDVEILYPGYLKATCNGRVRGAEVMALVFARNLPDTTLRVCCVVTPRGGSGRVLASSPLAKYHTVNDSLSGQERRIKFSNGEECQEVDFFVPFSVIDFKGNYLPQPLSYDIYVYSGTSASLLTQCHMEFDGLSPHTITVDGHVDDYDLEVDYSGGLFDPLIAVCSGNEPRWTDFPSWVVADETGVHILENETTQAREATFRVSSTGGGNMVNINVFQKGRTEELVPTAVINKVWNEVLGIKKVIVHVDCEVSGARGKNLRAYAFFYCADGTTALIDMYGDEVRPFAKAFAGFTESSFDDIPIEIGHFLLTNGTNNADSRTYQYYICITTDKGLTCLARSGPYTLRL